MTPSLSWKPLPGCLPQAVQLPPSPGHVAVAAPGRPPARHALFLASSSSGCISGGTGGCAFPPLPGVGCFPLSCNCACLVLRCPSLSELSTCLRFAPTMKSRVRDSTWPRPGSSQRVLRPPSLRLPCLSLLSLPSVPALPPVWWSLFRDSDHSPALRVMSPPTPFCVAGPREARRGWFLLPSPLHVQVLQTFPASGLYDTFLKSVCSLCALVSGPRFQLLFTLLLGSVRNAAQRAGLQVCLSWQLPPAHTPSRLPRPFLGYSAF